MGFNGCLRDINFTEIIKDVDLINISDDELSLLKTTVSKDVALLSKYDLMDYSLLLVVENLPAGK